MKRAALLACVAGSMSVACAAPPYEARATYTPDEAARVLAAHPSRAWVVQSGLAGSINAIDSSRSSSRTRYVDPWCR